MPYGKGFRNAVGFADPVVTPWDNVPPQRGPPAPSQGSVAPIRLLAAGHDPWELVARGNVGELY